MTRTGKQFSSVLLGIVSALLASEVILRQFASGASIDGKSHYDHHVFRQYKEGVAVAHFEDDWGRCTGTSRIAGAPAGLIVGDSMVEALQVTDEETMGSLLERSMRDRGRPINVHQYGFPGTAIARYAQVGKGLVSRWNPQFVIIATNRGDFRYAPPLESEYLDPHADGSYQIVERPRQRAAPVLERFRPFLRTSVAANMLFQSVKTITSSNGDQSDDQPSHDATSWRNPPSLIQERELPAASVRALKDAYGDRLRIAYIADVIVSPDALQADWSEAELLAACQRERVPCISTRRAMVEYRDRFGELTRGFSNTVIGTGHLNTAGHQVVAKTMMDLLN